MAVRVHSWTDMGDGTVAVHGRTDAGSEVTVTMGWHRFQTASMYEMLTVAGARADADNAALNARKGRTDWSEP